MTLCSNALSVIIVSCIFMIISIFGQSKLYRKETVNNIFIFIFIKDNLDICNWIQCSNGGTCKPPVNNLTQPFRCECRFGFSGILCDDRVNITCKKAYLLSVINNDFIVACVKNPCLNNGNCTIASNRTVLCTCPKGTKGARCETRT